MNATPPHFGDNISWSLSQVCPFQRVPHKGPNYQGREGKGRGGKGKGRDDKTTVIGL